MPIDEETTPAGAPVGGAGAQEPSPVSQTESSAEETDRQRDESEAAVATAIGTDSQAESQESAAVDQIAVSAPVSSDDSAQDRPSPAEPEGEGQEAQVPEPAESAPVAEPPIVSAAEEAPAAAEPEPTPEPEPEAPRSDAELFEAAVDAMDAEQSMEGLDSSFKKLTKGDRVEATVIQVDSDRVFVDLGTKAEGIVPIAELTDDPIGHASEHVKVGDKIEVVVLRPEGAEGNPIVSKKRADFENAWLRVEHAFEKGEMITAPVIDRVKGGLVVDVGVRGFVPATHVGTGRLRNIDRYVGQTLDLRILEIDRERKKVVLSNRQAEELRRAKAREEIFEKVKPGDVLDGTIRRLTDYGAFVDLGGVDGLLHISEMSWMRITHPREMFREGNKIQVMVLRLDKDAGKISLGHRQVLPDPWNLIKENYRQGQKLTIKIGRLVQAGAFVKLPEGAEAFLPLSEMSVRRLKKPTDAVAEGQEIEVQILDLKPDDRRMVLSIRALGGGAGMAMPAATFVEDERESRRLGGKKKKRGGRRQDEEELEDYIGRRSFGGGGVTIGERLGMLRGFGTREEEELSEEPIADALEEIKASDSEASDETPVAESETDATPKEAEPEPSKEEVESEPSAEAESEAEGDAAAEPEPSDSGEPAPEAGEDGEKPGASEAS